MAEDPRALRSRRRLQEALHDLLTREALTDIGVAELCRAAGVHRTTFYGHYTNVGDVASDMHASWLDAAAEISVQPGDSLDDLAARYEEATTAVLRGITEERPALRALLASEFSLDFRRRLQALFDERCATALSRFRERGFDVVFDDAVAAAYVAGGFVGAALRWATSDDADEESYTRAIFQHLPAWWPRPA
ncbi:MULTISPECIES: TetR/AcrR family transcriptional regulator [unclassified Microbacterium]|uniref:TetR/AcrR family transcriptional regulator n=1 Tax=Microbacterium TaxID=33882 RepID=UPI003B9FCE22